MACLLLHFVGAICCRDWTPSLHVGGAFIRMFDWLALAFPSVMDVLVELLGLAISLNRDMCKWNISSLCNTVINPVCPPPPDEHARVRSLEPYWGHPSTKVLRSYSGCLASLTTFLIINLKISRLLIVLGGAMDGSSVRTNVPLVLPVIRCPVLCSKIMTASSNVIPCVPSGARRNLIAKRKLIIEFDSCSDMAFHLLMMAAAISVLIRNCKPASPSPTLGYLSEDIACSFLVSFGYGGATCAGGRACNLFKSPKFGPDTN